MRIATQNVYPQNILSEKKDDRDSARPEFWSQRYAYGKTPWELERVPPRLTTFIESLESRRNVLIPGCGRDYRTIDAFRRAGHQVTAIDFSPIAVESIRNAASEISHQIILGNFFAHHFTAAPFDLVYERTFLCSLPTSLWKDYATRVAELLRPGGTLAGFFFYGEEPEPPPYPLTKEKAAEIFASRFELQTSEPVTDSLSVFRGTEKWQEWRLQER